MSKYRPSNLVMCECEGVPYPHPFGWHSDEPCGTIKRPECKMPRQEHGYGHHTDYCHETDTGDAVFLFEDHHGMDACDLSFALLLKFTEEGGDIDELKAIINEFRRD